MGGSSGCGGREVRGSGRRKGRGARRSRVVVRLEFVCRKEDSICSATSSPVNRTCDFEHPRDRVPLSSEILGAKRVLEGGIKIVQHLVEPPTWPLSLPRPPSGAESHVRVRGQPERWEGGTRRGPSPRNTLSTRISRQRLCANFLGKALRETFLSTTCSPLPLSPPKNCCPPSPALLPTNSSSSPISPHPLPAVLPALPPPPLAPPHSQAVSGTTPSSRRRPRSSVYSLHLGRSSDPQPENRGAERWENKGGSARRGRRMGRRARRRWRG